MATLYELLAAEQAHAAQCSCVRCRLERNTAEHRRLVREICGDPNGCVSVGKLPNWSAEQKR